MARNDRSDDGLPPGLDPEVAALIRAAKADEAERTARNRGVDWGLDRRPVELKLKLGPTTLLCAGAGVLSAAGALILFSWPEADALYLLFSQLPAAGLITAAYARTRRNT